MIYKNIILAFALCVLSTFGLLLINRPDSSAFIPSMVLQTLAFAILVLLAFLLNKTTSISDISNYTVSFVAAYVVLLLVVWKINGSSFMEFIIKYHKGKDFWSVVVPFIISNLTMIIWQVIRK